LNCDLAKRSTRNQELHKYCIHTRCTQEKESSCDVLKEKKKSLEMGMGIVRRSIIGALPRYAERELKNKSPDHTYVHLSRPYFVTLQRPPFPHPCHGGSLIMCEIIGISLSKIFSVRTSAPCFCLFCTVSPKLGGDAYSKL
jgi:hypothetical protein